MILNTSSKQSSAILTILILDHRFIGLSFVGLDDLGEVDVEFHVPHRLTHGRKLTELRLKKEISFLVPQHIEILPNLILSDLLQSLHHIFLVFDCFLQELNLLSHFSVQKFLFLVYLNNLLKQRSSIPSSCRKHVALKIANRFNILPKILTFHSR